MTTPSEPANYYVEPRYQVHALTVAEFQEQCGDYIAKIAAAEDDRTVEVIIFDGDNPVAMLIPYEPPLLPDRPKIEVEILGDIVSPMPAEWYSPPAKEKE